MAAFTSSPLMVRRLSHVPRSWKAAHANRLWPCFVLFGAANAALHEPRQQVSRALMLPKFLTTSAKDALSRTGAAC